MGKARVNGVELHYQIKGSGPDLVLIHGITSSLAQWYINTIPALATDYRVTAYDLRGHGLSEITKSGYTSLSMAQDLLALMDQLGIERTHVVGHSFGGAIALHAAALAPERVKAIVLLDTGLACLRYLRVITDWPGWKEHGADLAKFGITLNSFLELDQNQDVTAIIRRSLSIPRQSGFLKGLTGLTRRMSKLLDATRMGSEFRDIAGLTEEKLAAIETPVFAVYGGTSPYEKMARHLSHLMPRCCYEMLIGAGHFYAVESPELALAHIKPFLQDPEVFVAERRGHPGINRDGGVTHAGAM
jgi:pimeloyl-ACP methyl ester carboxylesterase